MRATVQRNDPRFVNRLHEEHDVVFRLHDLVIRVHAGARRAGNPSVRGIPNVMQRVSSGRSVTVDTAAAVASRRCRPAAVYSGSRPFGGSVMSDVRFSNSTSVKNAGSYVAVLSKRDGSFR